ncbi:MAG: aminotransferase class I/II-fold pyridoxal phosphate-dependent enzyme [Clostridia bacterium]|nr:aminotransferase class I/II-fold pyridoxal phosphate-dependent enzyme [Clostridia bacterium]
MQKLSKRLEHFQTGIFARLTVKRDELVKQNKKVYNLYVGTPDFEIDEEIRRVVSEAAKVPENYKYSLVDSKEMLEAVKEYYAKRYGVEISVDEIASSNGSQDGIGHLGLALCDQGDTVLLPDPGYPVFEAGAFFAGATVHYYPLKKENNFLPDMKAIPEEVLKKVKYMIVSYPSNPCGAVANKEMYVELIKYAKKYGFYIINDNAYSDIIFDGLEGFSFLSIPGAKEVGVEFFSLSKSFNTTGARISFCIGNKEVVDAFRVIRSQYDFGMFKPIQLGAIAALKVDREKIEKQCNEYQARRDALCGGLRKIGWNVPDSKGTMFVWAPIPDGFASSMEFWEELVDKTGVICTPGNAFGPMGEGYVRFALVLPAEKLTEIVDVIDKSGVLKR